MIEHIGIEARLAWALLTGEGNNCLEEGGSPYAYEALELLEARELFNLMGRIRETLAARGIEADKNHFHLLPASSGRYLPEGQGQLCR